MPRGVYHNSKRRKTECPLRKRIVCKDCFNIFYPNINIKRGKRECPYCGRIIDIRDRAGYYKKYCEKYPEKAKKRFEKMKKYDKKYYRERGKKSRKLIRKVIFNIISKNNPHCIKCGCDDERFLEINHKNGGGNKELQYGKKANKFYNDIYQGRRKTDDLNLLCKICNNLHYLELKFGKLPYKIIYDKNIK